MKIYTILFISFVLSATFIVANAENGLRERVYIQTDKQTYLAGELIWLKLYLTDEKGVPSSFSKVGYIELLDESAAQVQVKMELSEGIGTGWMELPATLATGNYRLIGYTRQMKNEGENVFFNKTISVINTFRIDETIDIDSSSELSTPSVIGNNIVVSTDKNSYATRTRTNIQIKNLPENVYSLCVSVAGKDLVSESMNISNWRKVLSTITATPTVRIDFLPEYEGHIITGRMVDIGTGESVNNKINTVPFLSFVGDQIRLFNGKVGNDGNVQFFTKRIAGGSELVTSLYSFPQNKYRIDILSPFYAHTEKQLPHFEINLGWQEQLLQRSVGLQVSYGFVADSLSQLDTAFAHFQWKPDRSYILDEYTRFTRMDEVVIEFIPSLRFRKIDNKRILSVLMDESATFTIGNSLVLLDGIPILNHDIIYNYDPLLVYKIDVYKNRFDFADQFFDGIVSFTTYKSDYPTLKVDEQTQMFDYEGTQLNRLFYAPGYLNEEERKIRIPDYRHTLLWQPIVETAELTNIRIPFTTSDLTGEFQVVVEGLTRDGQVIRGMDFFNVIE